MVAVAEVDAVAAVVEVDAVVAVAEVDATHYLQQWRRKNQRNPLRRMTALAFVPHAVV